MKATHLSSTVQDLITVNPMMCKSAKDNSMCGIQEHVSRSAQMRGGQVWLEAS